MNDLGVDVKMITGDQIEIAIETARQLGLKGDIIEGSVLADDPDALRNFQETIRRKQEVYILIFEIFLCLFGCCVESLLNGVTLLHSP